MSRASYEYNGITGIPEIAKAYGINPNTIQSRLRRGLSLEEALQPVDVRKPKPKKVQTRPNTIAVRFPDLMTAGWRLALGVKG